MTMLEAAIRLPSGIGTRATNVWPRRIIRILKMWASLTEAALETDFAFGATHRGTIAGCTWDVVCDDRPVGVIALNGGRDTETGQ